MSQSAETRASQKHDYLFKIVLLGDGGVGKTSLLQRFTKDEFNLESRMTIGVEFSPVTVEIDKKVITAQIWDTCGQERFQAISSMYYRGAMGAMIVYDISSPDSFHNIQQWLEKIKSNADSDMVFLLVGNKSDRIDRRVQIHDGLSFAEKEGMLFTETSALDSSNVNKAFMLIMEEILRRETYNNASNRSKAGTSRKNPNIRIGSQKFVDFKIKTVKKKKKCCGGR